eukprot:496619-Pelagomonas_calceolata.AAC.1
MSMYLGGLEQGSLELASLPKPNDRSAKVRQNRGNKTYFHLILQSNQSKLALWIVSNNCTLKLKPPCGTSLASALLRICDVKFLACCLPSIVPRWMWLGVSLLLWPSLRDTSRQRQQKAYGRSYCGHGVKLSQEAVEGGFRVAQVGMHRHLDLTKLRSGLRSIACCRTSYFPLDDALRFCCIAFTCLDLLLALLSHVLNPLERVQGIT